MVSKLICTLIFAAFSVGCATSHAKHKKVIQNSESKAMVVRTTAYSHTESDHKKYGKKSAIGKNLVYNPQFNSAAADWSEFPVGTKFKIKGYPKIYVIDDYGSALVGTKTIDIYRPNKAGIKSWGVRYVDIEIVEWGCYKTSLMVIKGRDRFSHIRRMKSGIQQKLQLTYIEKGGY